MIPPTDFDQLLVNAASELPPPAAAVTDRARRMALAAAGVTMDAEPAKRRRWPLIVLVAAALVLLLGIGLAVASQIFDSAAPVVREHYPNGPDPGFLAGNGWHTAASHSPATPQVAIAVASTSRFDHRDFASARDGNFPGHTLAGLPADGILIVARFVRVPGNRTAILQPPKYQAFTLAGIPIRTAPGTVPRFGFAQLNAYYFGYQTSVYFGTSHPSAHAITEADKELAWIAAPVRPKPVSLTRASAQVTAMQMTSPTRGWAITAGDLLYTSDGGRSWRRIQPPGTANRIAGVLLNGQDGWLTREIDRHDTCRMVVYHTTNAGETWSHTVIAEGHGKDPIHVDCSGNTTYLSAPDRSTVFSMSEIASQPWPEGFLIGSQTAGRTWSPIPNPSGGRISFADKRHGWIVGGEVNEFLYHTTDGGSTWTKQRVLRPPHVTALPAFAPPTFLTRSDGWVAATYSGVKTTLAWYHTTNLGNTWTLASSVTLQQGQRGVSLPVSVAPGDRLLALDLNHNQLISTANGDTTRIPLPKFTVASITGGATSISFSSPTDGWAQVQFGACLDFKTDCFDGTLLYQTRDGGHTWQLLKPAARTP